MNGNNTSANTRLHYGDYNPQRDGDGFDRDDGADRALAEGREQLLEAESGDARTGAAEIVVNHFHGGPA